MASGKHVGRAVLTSALLCVITNFADAQNAQSMLQQARERAWVVRAVIDDTTVVLGRVQFVGEQTAGISNYIVDMSRIAALDRQVRTGAGPRTAAIQLAGVFGLLGAAAGPLACFVYRCSWGTVGSVAAGFVTGAAVGAGVGLVVGNVTTPKRPEWVRVWPVASREE